jgi:hypothetical protein
MIENHDTPPAMLNVIFVLLQLNDFYATYQVPGNLKIDYQESPTLCTDRGDSPHFTQGGDQCRGE